MHCPVFGYHVHSRLLIRLEFFTNQYVMSMDTMEILRDYLQ